MMCTYGRFRMSRSRSRRAPPVTMPIAQPRTAAGDLRRIFTMLGPWVPTVSVLISILDLPEKLPEQIKTREVLGIGFLNAALVLVFGRRDILWSM
jgi:hypothetical protein